MNDRAHVRADTRERRCPAPAAHACTYLCMYRELPIQSRNKLDAPGIRYLHDARTRQCMYIRRCLFTIKLEASIRPRRFLARKTTDSWQGSALGATVNDHILRLISRSTHSSVVMSCAGLQRHSRGFVIPAIVFAQRASLLNSRLL